MRDVAHGIAVMCFCILVLGILQCIIDQEWYVAGKILMLLAMGGLFGAAGGALDRLLHGKG